MRRGDVPNIARIQKSDGSFAELHRTINETVSKGDFFMSPCNDYIRRNVYCKCVVDVVIFAST